MLQVRMGFFLFKVKKSYSGSNPGDIDEHFLLLIGIKCYRKVSF